MWSHKGRPTPNEPDRLEVARPVFPQVVQCSAALRYQAVPSQRMSPPLPEDAPVSRFKKLFAARVARAGTIRQA